MISKERMKRLQRGFKYLEMYDELGDYPDKKVPVSISLPLELKVKLSRLKNKSTYIASLIQKDLARKKE